MTQYLLRAAVSVVPGAALTLVGGTTGMSGLLKPVSVCLEIVTQAKVFVDASV